MRRAMRRNDFVGEAAPPQLSFGASPDKAGAPQLRKLWLCADDYGISPAVNRAVRDLIGRGRVNATSVMVTAPSFSAAEALALSGLGGPDRRAAIGLHFTLTAPFRPSTRAYRPAAPDGAFLSLPHTLATGLLRRLDPGAL